MAPGDDYVLRGFPSILRIASEPAGEIASQLRTLGADDMAARLEAAIARLERLDATGIGHPPAEYVAVLETLKPLPAPVEISRLVQVDVCKPGQITLGPSVRAEIERCAEAVARFGVASDQLAVFRSAFDKRYGTAAMPLLQVLDEESGIGLGDTAPACAIPACSSPKACLVESPRVSAPSFSVGP